MNKEYHDALDKMEKAKVDRDYIIGWAGGYLHNPAREEQRVNEAYEAGYNDGQAKNTSNYSNWKGK